MSEHQCNYYVRQKAIKNYIKANGYQFPVSGGTWGVTININELKWKLDPRRLPCIYIAFNFPYKNYIIPIHLREGRSRW